MGSSTDAVRLVERFLRGPAAEFGPYSPVDEDEPIEAEELVAGRVYRLRMVDREERSVDIQLFLGIEEMGGLLWEQDVRSLLRMSGVPHPALPEMLGGGYLGDARTREADVPGGMAFVATRGSRSCAGGKEIAYFRTHRAEAVRQFRSLAEGVAELHFLGISHRSLSPASIDVYDGPTLRLARFELSSLIVDLFRNTVDSASDPGELREVLGQDLAYAPPERVAFLLGGDANLVESARSDVYGLAAVAWEWFLGPFPADRRPVWPDGPVNAETVRIARDASRSFAQYLGETVLASRDVPPDLAAVLAQMLKPDSEDRPAADAVVGMISAAYDRIMADIEGPAGTRKHLMIFMPAESATTIYRWGLVSANPQTAEGRQELAAYIASDMREAHMTYSEFGAGQFIDGDASSLREARQVIRGQELAWFCDYFRPMDEYGSLEAPTDHALIIKYVAQLSVPAIDRKLRKLEWSSSRLMPDLDVRAHDINAEVLARRIARAPSWRDLVDATRPVSTASPDELEFREAIDWLLEFQEVELAARAYPFQVAGRADRPTVIVRYDAERDQRRIVASPLFVKYAANPALRPEFGSFLGDLENEDGDSEVDILEDGPGRSGRLRRITSAYVDGREGPDRVLLRRKAGEPALPERGWIRPADDRGDQQSLARQRDASIELFKARYLQQHLRKPSTIRTFGHHWRDAGADLKGDGPDVVREILVCEPFAAVQGPPGTGKTRVAAAAIAAYLKKDPTARILVSAQSNFALDNLAVQILKSIGEMDSHGRPVRHGADDEEEDRVRPLALRVSTRGIAAQGRIDQALRPWRRFEAAIRLAADIRLRVDQLLNARKPELPDRQPDRQPDRLPAPLLDVLATWSLMLEDSGEWIVPELADRLHRGANLVFATCAAATPDVLSPSSEAVFNWVVVEEAAKAWPTELALPLLRGLRWTLIGDHFQLPAHRRQDLKRFLDACAADPHPQMAGITAQKVADYMEVFDLFGGLFAGAIGEQQPLRRMSVQFRMREPIAELVGRVFYPAIEQPPVPPADGLPVSGLSTYLDPREKKRIPAVRLRRPRELDGQSLVWLDTAGIASCHDEPHWWNSGEAALVLKLLGDLDPFPAAGVNGNGPEPLAVLTPYREQLRILRGSSLVQPYLSTVHAFQGREADTVIVSLVRDRVRGVRSGPAAVRAGLGHLAQRQLVNVLFSRARRQLVLIGRFDHYSDAGTVPEFWGQICRAIELYGVRVAAKDLYGDLPGLIQYDPTAGDRDGVRV